MNEVEVNVAAIHPVLLEGVEVLLLHPTGSVSISELKRCTRAFFYSIDLPQRAVVVYVADEWSDIVTGMARDMMALRRSPAFSSQTWLPSSRQSPS